MLTLSLALVMSACQSTPEEIPQDLQPREFFQKAQEAVVERTDYNTALIYYQTFLERYPDDIQRSVEAEYEIAFIRYKQGDLETAETLFSNLLARYEEEGAEVLPQWPLTLSVKIMEKLTVTEEE
jgi:outer membrane protein assembly factor BamD (BamD/ComL family)